MIYETECHSSSDLLYYSHLQSMLLKKNPSSRTMALGSTQLLTEMSTRNLPGGKKRPACSPDNLAAFYEPNVWKCGSLNLPQP
jgi:hypothetical protein